MVELHQYFSQNKWKEFSNLLIENELNNNFEFYNELIELNIFPDDINKILASLYSYSFYSKKDVFERWLNTKIKMLDNYTPVEVLKLKNGANSLREYLMRMH